MHYYHSALLEVDSQELGGRIHQAETAIQERLHKASSAAPSEAENHAIRDALQNLRVLREELRDSPSKPVTPRHTHPEVCGEYVVFVDANRRYLDMTEGVCSLLGYTREQLLDKTIDDITAPELKGNVSENFQKYVNAGGLSGQFLLLACDGRRVPILYEAKVFPDGCLVARWEPVQGAT